MTKHEIAKEFAALNKFHLVSSARQLNNGTFVFIVPGHYRKYAIYASGYVRTIDNRRHIPGQIFAKKDVYKINRKGKKFRTTECLKLSFEDQLEYLAFRLAA